MIIYGNSFQNAWHYDDKSNIIDNPNVHLETISFDALALSFFAPKEANLRNIRPLAFFSFALNYYLGGLKVWGFHVVNFSIHFLTGLILYRFLQVTLSLPLLKARYGNGSHAISLLAVFLWATHPIQVGAVTYIVQRMASMAALFYILSMYCFVRGRTATTDSVRILSYAGCIIAGAGAIASKENAVMLPLGLYFYDLFLVQGVNRQSLKRCLYHLIIPTAVIAFFIFILTDFKWLSELYSVREFTPIERLLTEARVIFFYLSLLVYPTTDRLALLHQIDISVSLLDPWSTLPAVAGVLILATMPFVIVKRWPLVAYCTLFYMLNHMVEGSILPLELIYEHRNYLPSMLIFVLPAIFVVKAMHHFEYQKPIMVGVALCTALLLFAQGHTTHLYNRIYHTELSLWFDNAFKYPNLSVVQNNLGSAWENLGFYEKAYQRFQEALRLDNFNNSTQKATVYYNMGLHPSYRLHHHAEGLEYFKKALEISKDYDKALFEAARTSMLLGDIDAARDYLDRGLKGPGPNANLKMRNALALVFLKQGHLVDAHREALAVLREAPDEIQPRAIIAEVLRRHGKPGKAASYWEAILEKSPDHLEANLAMLDLSHSRKQFQQRNHYALQVLRHAKGEDFSALLAEYIANAKLMCAFVPEMTEVLEILEISMAAMAEGMATLRSS